MGSKDTLVRLKDINKQYGEKHVIKDFNLDIYDGEFLTISGPSGCGKTAIYRMIAGFETPDSGELTLKGRDLINKAPLDRSVNTVFQSYAMFPHMTIFDNIAFGLKTKNRLREDIKLRVDAILELIGLKDFRSRYPHQLSGTQRQKIAVARALVNDPKVLLFDEPLAPLSLELRKALPLELKRIQKKLGITFIYITQNPEEALAMSDRIVILNNGSIEQIGTPKEIYEKPQTKFAATFIAETNLFEATVASIEGSEVLLNLETGCMCGINNDFKINEIVYVSVRPEKINFGSSAIYQPSLTAVVKEHVYMGTSVRCIATLPNGQEIKIQRLNGDPLPMPGDIVNLYWHSEDAVIIHARENILLNLIENINLSHVCCE